MKPFSLCFYFTFLVLATILSVTSACIRQTRTFVDGHNSRRLLVGSGKVKRQPGASIMNSMMWDQELAQKARGYAAQHKFTPNENKTVPSQRFIVGENLYLHMSTDPFYILRPEEAMNAWFMENDGYDYDPNKFQAGYYTQMVWSNSIYLGCAISRYFDNGWYNTLVVCYYGPGGNIIGLLPYQEGGPVQNLSCGCKTNDPNCNCDMRYGRPCNLLDLIL